MGRLILVTGGKPLRMYPFAFQMQHLDEILGVVC